ncbi:protein translocase subunit SecD, partial [Candidatus Similichlamydia epinepheli]|uniref:protein translocase subunit SecD n=1 Tax=Candidatus Similichlamydia epinepheli TaxID=1903953 RepID=UPI00186437C1
MQKGNSSALAIILAVSAFGFYSLLPSFICYWKDLDGPVVSRDAEQEISMILDRVEGLKPFSIKWIKNYCHHLRITPERVQLDHRFPRLVKITFQTKEDLDKCRESLNQAGRLIRKAGGRLFTMSTDGEESKSLASSNEKLSLIVSREPIPDLKDPSSIEFITKFDKFGDLSEQYKNLIVHRAKKLQTMLENRSNQILQEIQQSRTNPHHREPIISAASKLHQLFDSLDWDSELLQRVGSWIVDKKHAVQKNLISLVRHISQNLREGLTKEEGPDQEKISKKIASLDRFLFLLQSTRLSSEVIEQNQSDQMGLTLHHPFFESILIDWNSHHFEIKMSEKLKEVFQEDNSGKNLIKDWVFSEINRLRELCGERFSPQKDGFFKASFERRPETTSFLKLNNKQIHEEEKVQLAQFILSHWHPETPELSPNELPLLFADEYNASPPQDRRLSFLIFSPLCDQLHDLDFSQETHSVYFIFSGHKEILRKKNADPAKKTKIESDLKHLFQLLHQQGYTLASGDQALVKAFPDAIVLALSHPVKNWIRSSREKFRMFSDFSLLEMSNKKSRILARNQIDKEAQEDLLKWKDDYRSAQSELNPKSSLLVPPPWQFPIIENAKLSLKRYWNGDVQRAIRWGLDLSGGKSVRIALLDTSGRVVTDTTSLLQGREELVKRVNRMGLSEVSVYLEKDSLVFDFPGSQGFSASELIEATSMTFHIVNETFFQKNDPISEDVNRFLQKVWDEAVLIGNIDRSHLNELAYEHLHGTKKAEDGIADRLLASGLKFVGPNGMEATSSLDEEFSIVAPFQVDPEEDDLPRRHPLILLFRNYALRGSDVTNVRASYESMRGHFLNFEVKNNNDQGENPQESFKEWTGFYCKDSITGTPKQIRGEYGWRMAVLLDNEVISIPELQSELSSGASISGNFSQREASRLADDLKAGSLSFKPKILSEETISAELGVQERERSLFGFQIALVLVGIIMCSYYRFWGSVASVALLLNLFLLFALLRQTGATLSLAGLAGIVLTLGMSVDSNVLVFERIREELEAGLPLIEATYVGYKRAFAAVLDSSVTTLLACFILAKFDCGPVKGFAITLSIGIFVSIFTAIFSTRTFFSILFSKGKSFPATMSRLFSNRSIPLFRFRQPIFLSSLLIIVSGWIFLWENRANLIGVDLAGGTTLNLDFPQGSGQMREQVKQAFDQEGISQSLYRLQERGAPERLRIYLSGSSSQYFEEASDLCKILENNGVKISSETLKKANESLFHLLSHLAASLREIEVQGG